MAVFRIEKTRDYTVMSNHHLKDRTLTLKSKGLLSMMLSLPDEWNYTTRGLAAICREGVDSICRNRMSDTTSVPAFFLKASFGRRIAPSSSALCAIYRLASEFLESMV